MKSKKKILSKVEQFFKKELAEFRDIFLIKTGENSYVLFEEYALTKKDDRWIVKHKYLTIEFEKLSSATAWAILYNAKQYTDSHNLKHWDNRSGLLSAELDMMQKKINNQNPVIDAKINEIQFKLNTAKRELKKYINLAKYWQTKGFNNEIATSCTKKKFSNHR